MSGVSGWEARQTLATQRIGMAECIDCLDCQVIHRDENSCLGLASPH